ncbi:uncharacterized protein [Argopecten irradians]|uniref:uncharacterized protein n=1 Tax=Argopecten irradians TaxID=31199 RepID=UPI003714FF55
MYLELFVIILVMSSSLGCQKNMSGDFRDRVEFSHLVATGEITESFSPTSFQMTLKCILKDNGTQPEAVINITHTSQSIEGRCFINNFQESKSYLVFLRYVAPSYQPQSSEEEPSKTPDVLTVCGLGVVSKVPKGTDESSSDCENIVQTVCSTTQAPTTTLRHKKTPPGFLKTTTPVLDPTVRSSETPKPTAVISKPNNEEDKHHTTPNHNNTATQRQKSYITWCITWYAMLFYRTV